MRHTHERACTETLGARWCAVSRRRPDDVNTCSMRSVSNYWHWQGSKPRRCGERLTHTRLCCVRTPCRNGPPITVHGFAPTSIQTSFAGAHACPHQSMATMDTGTGRQQTIDLPSANDAAKMHPDSCSTARLFRKVSRMHPCSQARVPRSFVLLYSIRPLRPLCPSALLVCYVPPETDSYPVQSIPGHKPSRLPWHALAASSRCSCAKIAVGSLQRFEGRRLAGVGVLRTWGLHVNLGAKRRVTV